MNYLYFIISIVLLSIATFLVPKKEQLTEVPIEDALYRIVNGQKQAFIQSTYKNAQGEPLSKVESKLLNEGQLARRYYQNDKGEIKEIRCHRMMNSDTLIEYRLTKLIDKNPFDNIEQVSIDCSDTNMAYIYNKLFSDKRLELNKDTVDFLRFAEVSNKTLLVSVIEQCGFPFQKETVKAAHEIILYSGISGLAEYYYPEFSTARRILEMIT